MLVVFLPQTEKRESDENVFARDVRALLTSKANRSEFTLRVDFQKLLVECNKNPLTRQILDKERSPD